jgi:chromosome segregation ATPase
MSGNPMKEDDKPSIFPEIDGNLSNAQKIKALQSKAKEIQKDINKLNKKVEETEFKYKEFNPIYENYKRDFENLKKKIRIDEEKVKELELELKTRILKKQNSSFQDYNKIDLKSVRSIDEVKESIKQTDDEIKSISIPTNLLNLQNPDDLSEIIKKFSNFNNKIQKNHSKIKISKKNDEINKIFRSFQKLENLINSLEKIINKFLSQINIITHFSIVLKEDKKDFFLQIGFIRNNKEKLKFEQLTTPEKIYFIIACNISFELQVKNYNIVFSNLFIPNIYNKAGSIFRTIRKILPVFDTEESLSTFNLVFILSNLEMKKELKNVKIITLPENE